MQSSSTCGGTGARVASCKVMNDLSRVVAYLGVCAVAVAGAVVAPTMLASPGASPAQPASVPPKIAAWLERKAVPMPELPKPHGPALTTDELQAFKDRDKPTRQSSRIPIGAESTSEPPPPPGVTSSPARTRPSQKSPSQARTKTSPSQRPAAHRHSSKRDIEAVSAAARSSESATYEPTARERYALERIDN
jgi:hypothetical protein